MKNKFIILFVLTLAFATSVLSQECTLKLIGRSAISGTFVEATDTTITLIVDGTINEMPVTMPASRMEGGKLPHGVHFVVRDGKIVQISKEEAKLQKKQNKEAKVQNKVLDVQKATAPANPNYMIGKALKTSGATALGVGVPCLAAGLATCIAGNVMPVSKYGTGLTTKSNLMEASYYLLPIGASLTIVGIPLHIGGKKIMDLNVNYTGNGAGLTMKF